MSSADRPSSLPYRAISAALVCAVAAFGVAVAAGVLEVRRPARSGSPARPEPEAAPKCYVQRVKSAESLLDGQHVLWVYRFAGGLPKCWAEIDSEGHKRTLGPWASVKSAGFVGEDPVDQPVPESVEGYVALFGPTSKEQTYRLVCAVTRVEYPVNPKQPTRVQGFRDVLQVKLPDMIPAPERPKGNGPLNVPSARGGVILNDGEEPRTVRPGEDVRLNFREGLETPAGKDLNISLTLRFLTPEEVSAARR